MTVIIARGADSSEAMDEVIRRLGVNAYILSTSYKDGQVEIKASAELPGKAAPAAKTVPEAEGYAERAQRFSDLLEARSDWAPVAQPQPVVPPRRTPWARISPSARHGALVDRLEIELLAPDPLPLGILRPRTVIVGPPGAGKSLLAARLAAAAILANRAMAPRIIAPRMANLLSEDRLRGWSRLLGILPEHPLIGDLLQNGEDYEPVATVPQIIDMSDVPDVTPELAAALAAPMPTEIIIALPAGLSARRTSALVRGWAGLSPRICLTFCDQAGPETAQMQALVEGGLRLSRAAQGTGLIDTLLVPERGDLARWVQEEAQENDAHTPETIA
jgi:hypothetical protein